MRTTIDIDDELLEREAKLAGPMDRATLIGEGLKAFIERQSLYGKGIGYVDAHLHASARLTDGATMWRRDRRLRAAAEKLGCAFGPRSAH